MKSTANHLGMTILEVIVALAIALISLAVLMHLILSNRAHKSGIDRSIIIKEVLTNNVIEVKAADTADLPAAGNCVVRLYDFQLKFISETKVAGTKPACKQAPPSVENIQVIWETEPSSAIDVTFSSPSLQLPKYSSTFKKINVYVRGYLIVGAENRFISNQVTLFKR